MASRREFVAMPFLKRVGELHQPAKSLRQFAPINRDADFAA